MDRGTGRRGKCLRSGGGPGEPARTARSGTDPSAQRAESEMNRARLPPTMPTLALTGADGYVGGAVRLRAKSEGWTVVGVDDGSGPVCPPVPTEGVVRCDFASPEGLSALKGADVVLHLAAVSGVMACANDPEGTRRVNVDGTRRLLAFCRAERMPIAFASSLAAVGSPARLPVSEETPVRPTHEYARQKADGEEAIRTARLAGLRAIAVRMSNVYGSYRRGGRTVAKGNLLNAYARQVPEGRLVVNAPGTQRRDFLHLDDAVSGWIALAHQLAEGRLPPLPVGLFARGTTYSVLEIAELTRRACAARSPPLPVPKVEIVPNPRGAIELLDEAFETDPRRTWAALEVVPRHAVPDDLGEMLGSRP